MIKILDYFFFLRPVLFFPAWSTVLIAHFVSNPQQSIHTFIIINSELSLILLVFALLMGSAFIVNQIYDIETDTHNKKLFFLEKKIISIKEARNLSIFSAVLGFILAAYLSIYILIISLSFYLVSAILYNLRPFRWKNKWLGGTLSNFIFGVCAFLYGVNFEYLSMVMNEFYIMSLFNIILCILTTLPDQVGDKKVGKKTIANVLGIRITIGVIVGLNILMILIILFNSLSVIFTLLASASFILTSYLIFNSKDQIILSIIKILLLIESLIATYFYNDYLILILLMYFVGRWYYKKRFNLNYPNLVNE